jgi:hypothetical protein
MRQLRHPLIPVLVFLSLPLLPTSLQGQEEVIPLLKGEVSLAGEPLTQGTVVLHQVSEAGSGEIDSVRVNPDGSFQVRLPHVPDHATRPEIFFASVEYGGLLYFGPAVTEAVQLDSVYRIQAFDTLSVPSGGATIPLAARNLFLEKTTEGWTVTDVFQLNHEGDRTLYSPEEGIVWAYPIPPSATDFQLGQADLAPDAIQIINGRMEVSSPLPPGEKYLMVRYRLTKEEFVLPLPGRTDRLEILVREPAPAFEFPPLVLSAPVELEPGNAFRRFAGDGLVDSEVRGRAMPEPWSLPPEWVGLLMAGLLGAAGVIGFRRRGRAPVGEQVSDTGHQAHGESPSREDLLVAIAALDEDFQAAEGPTEEALIRYEKQREKLFLQLKKLS